ncbi:MAG: GNAT family N-acetyltransferase [Treponemataceae bacterium]|nr:GNAT family N-acetyltransferase [Treponemataceae bacterium]
MEKIEIIRAEEEWQRAGAYSVRIQGMNRQYHISLRDEFDEHDCDGTKYIVLLDEGYPIATCRFYPLSTSCVSLGRVVVLPEYRGRNLGRLVIQEAERWIKEIGYKRIVIDSRTVAVKFYEKLGFSITDKEVIKSGDFDCIRMSKEI